MTAFLVTVSMLIYLINLICAFILKVTENEHLVAEVSKMLRHMLRYSVAMGGDVEGVGRDSDGAAFLQPPPPSSSTQQPGVAEQF